MQETARDKAVDFLSAESESSDPVAINATTLARIKAFVDKSPGSKPVLWKGFGIKRFVTDPIDLRQGRQARPAIVSYKYDKEADRQSQLSFIGGVQLYSHSWGWPSGAGSGPTVFLTLAPGIDFDVDGNKKTEETTVSIGVPVSLEWVRESPWLSDMALTVKPKFETDRKLKREVREVQFAWSFASQKLGNGYFTPLGSGKFKISWLPLVGLEVGKVYDAGGNENLQTLESDPAYVRLAPRISFSIIRERLVFGMDYAHRFDLKEGWDRGYGEMSVTYDLNQKKNIQFTLYYRRGRKPPYFKQVNEFVIGVGFLL